MDLTFSFVSSLDSVFFRDKLLNVLSRKIVCSLFQSSSLSTWETSSKSLSNASIYWYGPSGVRANSSARSISCLKPLISSCTEYFKYSSQKKSLCSQPSGISYFSATFCSHSSGQGLSIEN